ncbi:MAG: TetR/AcrR family transcriptional regulator [Deltaproteobacteria bacterium]|nr:TetR/AcrR family transcriptional regulator [Deltaproteobacteria bacterium]
MAEDTQEKILEAADALFCELGFEAASTRLIAERSGVNKALIHYHFRNKDELFGAVLDRYYERLGGVLGTALGAEGSVRDRFVALIDAYVDFLRENQGFSHIVQREAAGGRHVERIASRMTPLLQSGVALLRATYPHAFPDDVGPAQVLLSFYGMVISTFTYAPVLAPLLGFDPLGEEALAARKAHLQLMVDLIVRELERPRKEGEAS